MKCRSCGAPIVWATTAAGKATPMQPDPVGGWTIDADGVARKRVEGDGVGQFFVSHFAVCPEAANWRRRK